MNSTRESDTKTFKSNASQVGELMLLKHTFLVPLFQSLSGHEQSTAHQDIHDCSIPSTVTKHDPPMVSLICCRPYFDYNLLST